MNVKVHPIEEVLGMATEYFDRDDEYATVPEAQLAPPPIVQDAQEVEPPKDVKDEDDKLIDKNIDDVYAKAMETFNAQTEMVEIVDPRYSARTAEVAANYLNIALNAMAVKSRVKGDRVKRNVQSGFVPYANGGAKTVNNNLIVADRNDILKMMMQDDKPGGEK